MSRFFSRERAAILAVSAALSMAAWALAAAPQARIPRAKIQARENVAPRPARASSAAATSSVRRGRNLGLITSDSPPGVFLLNPDTNEVSGPILADQIIPGEFNCAAIAPDGLSGFVETVSRDGTAYGFIKHLSVSLFDLADPAAPVLKRTDIQSLGNDVESSASHLAFTPNGKFVLLIAQDVGYIKPHTEMHHYLETFQASSGAMIFKQETGLSMWSSNLPLGSSLPQEIVAADQETVLVSNLSAGFDPFRIYRLDQVSGQLSYQGPFSSFAAPGAMAISLDGRTVIAGSQNHSDQGHLLFLRLDSPGNLVYTGDLHLTGDLNMEVVLISIAFAPDGKRAYVLAGGSVRVLNVPAPGVVVDSGLSIPLQASEAAKLDSFAIEPGGRYAYVGGTSPIQVIDLERGAVVSTLGLGGNSISFPALADVGLSESVDNPCPVPGSSVSFTVTASDTYAREASGVKISDKLPDGLTYVSHSATVGSYDPATGIWDVGSLGHDSPAILTIRVRVDKIGSMTNTARLVGLNEPDADATNDAASVTVDADVPPDFSNATLNYESADALAVQPGQTVTFTVHYADSGGRATGVIITGLIDPNLENVQLLDGGQISGGQIVWNAGRVAASASGSVRFQASVKMGVPRGTKISSRATLVSAQTSPVATNTLFVTVL